MTNKQKENLCKYYRTTSLRLHFAEKDLTYAKTNDEVRTALQMVDKWSTEVYGIKSALALMGYKFEKIDDKFNFRLEKAEITDVNVAIILS